MIDLRPYFRIAFILAVIVLTSAITSCGGGASESSQAVDGTTISASTPSVSSIYIANSAASNKQATLFFTVTKNGVPQPNITINVSLNSQALAAGVTFFGGSTSLSLLTSSSGLTPSFAVVSGNIPTNVVVKGAIADKPSVVDYSVAITVSSGSPAQDRFSLAIETDKTVTESWSNITLVGVAAYVADRLGNPVPDGTTINFSASSGGTVTSSCATVNSSCSVSVTLNRNGSSSPFVSILAYAVGEETFIDTNGNNKYDSGELFVDLGNIYRDDDLSNSYSVGEQIFPTTNNGTSACPVFETGKPNAKLYSVPNTCSGGWNDTIQIRARTVLYLAESSLIANFVSQVGTTINFTTSGVTNGGQPPVKTSVAIDFPFLPTGSTCSASTVTNSPVSASATPLTPSSHSVTVTAACTRQQMRVLMTTPSGSISASVLTLP